MTLFPIWSYVIHAITVCLVIGCRSAISAVLKRGGTSQAAIIFKFFDELLSSTAWVVFSLECPVVGITRSKTSLLAIIALRLFLAPPFLGSTHFNPCGTLYRYLLGVGVDQDITKPSLRTSLVHLLAETLAIPLGSLISMATWTILAENNLSSDHTYFLDAQPEFFLSVSSPTGFVIELSISFVMFLLSILLPETRVYRISQVLLMTFLISIFGPMTGAFINPMVALTFLLMWHRGMLGLSALASHFFVFWLGPLVGTAMAVGVVRTYFIQKSRVE